MVADPEQQHATDYEAVPVIFTPACPSRVAMDTDHHTAKRRRVLDSPLIGVSEVA